MRSSAAPRTMTSSRESFVFFQSFQWLKDARETPNDNFDYCTTCVKSISPKMKTVHLLTRNVQIFAHHGSIYGVVSPSFDDGRHSLWHGLIERIEVLREQSVSRTSFQTFPISDLNKPTS